MMFHHKKMKHTADEKRADESGFTQISVHPSWKAGIIVLWMNQLEHHTDSKEVPKRRGPEKPDAWDILGRHTSC